MRFKDKVAAVTGGTGALERYIVEAFHGEDARLAVPYIADEELPELMELIGDECAAVRTYKVDVTSEEAVSDIVSDVLKDFGSVDILINAVGGYKGGPTVVETSLQDWDFMMDLNLRSTLLCCRAFVPHMVKAGGGKVVNVASRTGLRGEEGHASYSVSKAGVIRLTESLAEVARRLWVEKKNVVQFQSRSITLTIMLAMTMAVVDRRMTTRRLNIWVSRGHVLTLTILFSAQSRNSMRFILSSVNSDGSDSGALDSMNTCPRRSRSHACRRFFS